MLHAALEPGRELDHSPIDLAHERPTIIGPVMVEPSLRRLSSEAGERILEPKVMQVLVALMREPGAILSRDDLLEVCWNGYIVGDASINRVISLLRTALRDLAGDEVVIDTVAKVGYRLLCREPGAGGMSKSILARWRERLTARAAILALAVLALLVAAAVWVAQGQSATSPSIRLAILPLETEQEADRFFAGGLTEELRTALQRGYDIRVIGRSSAEALAKSDVDPARIAKRLGVDYVLGGKIAFEDDRVSVVLALHTPDGNLPAWQGEYASSLSGSGSLPLRLAKGAGNALGVAPSARFGDRTGEIPSEAAFLTALGMTRSRDPEQLSAAIELLRKVTVKHPEFGAGWSALAKAQNLGFGQVAENDRARFYAKLLENAQRGLRLDPKSAEAHAVMGLVSHDPGERVKHLQHAVQIDPTHVEAWLWLGSEQVSAGKLRAGLDSFAKLVTLDPLWSRAQAAPGMAGSLGKVALADRLDREIEAAAIEQWQRDLARGRIARRHGDWSAFIRLYGEAAPRAPASERFDIDFRRHSALAFLGVSIPSTVDRPMWVMGHSVVSGRMPGLATLRRNGVSGRTFFLFQSNVATHGPILMLREGRAAEYLMFFDEQFGSIEEMLAQARLETGGEEAVNHAAPYLALAMRQSGRDQEAERLLSLVRPNLARSNKQVPVSALVNSARNFAVAGKKDTALKLLATARSRGWPHTANLRPIPLVVRLDEDPAFASLLGHPGFRRIAAEVEAERAKERREVEALP